MSGLLALWKERKKVACRSAITALIGGRRGLHVHRVRVRDALSGRARSLIAKEEMAM